MSMGHVDMLSIIVSYMCVCVCLHMCMSVFLCGSIYVSMLIFKGSFPFSF